MKTIQYTVCDHIQYRANGYTPIMGKNAGKYTNVSIAIFYKQHPTPLPALPTSLTLMANVHMEDQGMDGRTQLTWT